MSIIKHFCLPHSSNVTVNLPNQQSKQNRTTVLLGVNGTCKSTLLRGLLDDGMNALGAKISPRYPGLDTAFGVRPRSIIAVSAVPNDRFPSNSKFGGGPLMRTRYSTAQYTYIGPRQSQNLISRSQSVQALIAAVLEAEVDADTQALDKRAFITKLTKKTSVPAVFFLRLRGQRPKSPQHRNGKAVDYFEIVQNEGHLTRRFPEELLETFKSAITRPMLEELDRLHDFFAQSRQNSFRIDLTGEHDFADFEPKTIYLALQSRFLYLDDLSFTEWPASDKPRITEDDFSAGQWGLFSSLATLALATKSNTLILADEPESALHPSWQREYLDDLHEAISHRTDCHIVLATHSPLVVGSLRTKYTDLVILRRRGEDGSICAELSDIPVGWGANDVLEEIFDLPSTRSPRIVERLDEALALVAKGVKVNHKRIHAIATELLPLATSLPEDDTVKTIIKTLLKISAVK